MEENVFPRFGRVAIVDDKIEEVIQIQNILARKGVPYIFYNYQDLLDVEINRIDGIRLLFLDIRLEAGTSNDKNLLTILASTVEKIIPPNNGPYAIVLWTNEYEKKKDVIKYLNNNLNDSETTKPSYIGAIDKKVFIDKTSDLENELKEYYNNQNMLAFLMEIENHVMNVPAKVVKMISYSFVKDASNDELEKLFLRFARTEKGNCDSPENATKTVLRVVSDLIRDRYMEIASNDTLVDKLSELWKAVDFADEQTPQKVSAEQAAIINTVLNVNIHAKSTDRVPGKVYRKNDEKFQIDLNTLKISTFQEKKSYIKEGSFNLAYQGNKIETYEEPIEIDITPSCDYAQGKNHMLRTLYGYVVYIGKDSEVLPDIDYVKKIKEQVYELYVYVSPLFKIDKKFCVLLLNTKMMDLEKEDFSKGLEYLFRLNDEITNLIRQKTGEILSRIGINEVGIKIRETKKVMER